MSTKTDAELDQIFDDGEEDILQYADMTTAHRPNREKLRAMSIQLPEWLVGVLDREAGRMGISRQAVMKVWLTERADSLQRA